MATMQNFSTSKQAADVAGITPEDIGVAANNFVRKKDLVATGKFSADSLTGYSDNDYVLIKDIAKGTFQVTLSLNSDVQGRGTVQINDGEAGQNATLEVNVGESITAKCNLTNEEDVFDGWYDGNSKVSSNQNYTFEVQKSITLVAKILYLDVTPTSLDFEPAGGEKTFEVSSNVSWSVK